MRTYRIGVPEDDAALIVRGPTAPVEHEGESCRWLSSVTRLVLPVPAREANRVTLSAAATCEQELVFSVAGRELGRAALAAGGAWTETAFDLPADLDAHPALEIRCTTIAAGGYFLLERTDDETVSDIEADVLYKGTISNTGVVIELRNARGEVVDRVATPETGWPAGTAGSGEPPYTSMELVDALTDVAEWADNDGRIRNGTDAKGDPLNGTPKAENSASIIALAAPRVELIEPAEEAAVVSGIVIIEWSATDPDGSAEGLAMSIEISLDGGGTWEVLVENLANGGRYAWNTTLHPDGDQVRLRVSAEDVGGYRGSAESAVLTIRNGAD